MFSHISRDGSYVTWVSKQEITGCLFYTHDLSYWISSPCLVHIWAPCHCDHLYKCHQGPYVTIYCCFLNVCITEMADRVCRHLNGCRTGVYNLHWRSSKIWNKQTTRINRSKIFSDGWPGPRPLRLPSNVMTTREFPAQRPVTWSFDVFFDLRLNKRMGEPWGWWHETQSRPLWRHCNVDCLLNSYSGNQIRNHQSATLLPHCEEKPPVTDGFSSQRVDNTHGVSTSWRLYGGKIIGNQRILHAALKEISSAVMIVVYTDMW